MVIVRRAGRGSHTIYRSGGAGFMGLKTFRKLVLRGEGTGTGRPATRRVRRAAIQ